MSILQTYLFLGCREGAEALTSDTQETLLLAYADLHRVIVLLSLEIALRFNC